MKDSGDTLESVSFSHCGGDEIATSVVLSLEKSVFSHNTMLIGTLLSFLSASALPLARPPCYASKYRYKAVVLTS